MKKKLLISAVHMEIGGIESVLVHFLNNLDAKKYDIDLILFKPVGEFYKSLPSYVNVYPFYHDNRFYKLIDKIIKTNNIFIKIIKHILFNYYTAHFFVNKKKYDIAIDYAGYYGFMDKYTSKINASKRYIWVHNDYLYMCRENKKFKNKFERTKNKYHKFDKIVCVSEGIAKNMIKLLPEYKEKIMYIWNFNDIKNIHVKTELKLTGNYKIISVGRFVNQKGFDRLVEVQKKLIDNGYSTKIYIAGDGPLKNDINDLIVKYRLEKSIILLGKRRDVLDLLKQSDLFLLTSYYEGFPTVLLESLMCSLPIVAPNVTGVNDIYKYIAPKGSFILTEDNIEGIYNGVVQAIKGKLNKKFDFDIKKLNKKILKDIEKIL